MTTRGAQIVRGVLIVVVLLALFAALFLGLRALRDGMRRGEADRSGGPNAVTLDAGQPATYRGAAAYPVSFYLYDPASRLYHPAWVLEIEGRRYLVTRYAVGPLEPPYAPGLP